MGGGCLPDLLAELAAALVRLGCREKQVWLAVASAATGTTHWLGGLALLLLLLVGSQSVHNSCQQQQQHWQSCSRRTAVLLLLLAAAALAAAAIARADDCEPGVMPEVLWACVTSSHPKVWVTYLV
jgi:uncharacterized membrane protein